MRRVPLLARRPAVRFQDRFYKSNIYRRFSRAKRLHLIESD
jgi:hypothetical protein